MSTSLSNETLAKIALGRQVTRATANLPQSTTANIFTVTGGRIEIVRLVGLVTTVLGSGANLAKFIVDPTTGTTGDLCTTTDIDALEAGGMITIDGIVGNALVKANAFAIKQMATRLWVPAGVIQFSCNASKSGQMSFVLMYVPIDSGASVAAA